jgi:hypothetical protein
MTRKVQIQVPAPCTQSWEEMQTVPGGKFCDSCEKKVIDFTLLNDRQIIDILRKNNKGCGRFTDEQLNRELLVTSSQSNSFVPAVIVSTVLTTAMATAAHAAPMQQDTSVTAAVKDSIPAVEDHNLVPGYYALKEDLVVMASGMPAKRYTTTGAIAVIESTTITRRRSSFFRRILITLGLSKKPA